jgi:hypothetical protein
MSSRIRKRAYHTLLQAFRLKKRKRMGRPRLAERPLTSGHARDKERAENVVSVASEARQRRYRISPIEALQPEWGTALGRMCKAGLISKPQLEAGDAYRRMRRDYDEVMGAKRLGSGSDIDRGLGGYDGSDGTDEAWVKRDRRARSEHAQCFMALLATCDLYAVAAIERAVIDDHEIRPGSPMLGSLRLALNAVGKVLR